MSTDRDYLAAGLALGGLSDAELVDAQALAESDADFRSEVAAYEDTMALMAESDAEALTAADAPESAASDDAMEPVSAATRDAILSIPATHSQSAPAQKTPEHNAPEDNAPMQNTQAPPPPPADLAEHRRKRQPWVTWGAAAAAIVVIAVIGVNSWQLQQKQNELEEELTTTQQQLKDSTRLMEAGDLRTSTADLPEGGAVTVFSSESEQLIRLSPRDVDAAPAGKSLQMWVIGDQDPQSVGLMTGEPVTIADEPFTSSSLFGITVEPEGGSDQPTADPIVAIDL